MKIEDLALTFVPNLTPEATAALIAEFGDAQAVYAATSQALVARVGLREDIARAIEAKVGIDAARKEIEICKRGNIEIVAAVDGDYPNRLLYTHDYPHIIYMVGAREIVDCTMLCAFIGDDNNCSSYGSKMAVQLMEQMAELAPEVVVVGSLSSFMDRLVLRYAHINGLRSIGVTKYPLAQIPQDDGYYIAREILESGGALVSAVGVMSTAQGEPDSFRERLVAGLSDGVVVIEAAEIPSVAHYADSYGRCLMALPGRVTDIYSRGANRMIANSMAAMVYSAKDIVKQLDTE